MGLDEMYGQMGISETVLRFADGIEEGLWERFKEIDEMAEYNQMKVLGAMQEHRLSDLHFAATTGYGYNDLGRDVLEKVYASVFRAEDALVRPQIVSGTHALTVALFGALRPGDELLSPVGKPYDTLEGVIGTGKKRDEPGSLREHGITYRQVELKEDGSFDYDGIRAAIHEKTRLITIQRSKGYDERATLSVERIGELVAFVKSVKPDAACMVDNCYGELVEAREPTEVGADMCVGSLIKNPGGGLAPLGGYVVGRADLVERAAVRLTTPGLGKEVGATLGINQMLFQGLFQAPQVVAGALKGAIYAASLYEALGFYCIPNATEKRHDIIQAIRLDSREGVVAFCEGIQEAAPVDAYVRPEPYAMPGYHCDVIMAAGTFVQGSSVELSADAPMEEPYSVYFQGGLSWHHAKFGILKSLQKLHDESLVAL